MSVSGATYLRAAATVFHTSDISKAEALLQEFYRAISSACNNQALEQMSLEDTIPQRRSDRSVQAQKIVQNCIDRNDWRFEQEMLYKKLSEEMKRSPEVGAIMILSQEPMIRKAITRLNTL